MNLIILPCCYKKNPGGKLIHQLPVALLEVLGLSLYTSLLDSRRELAHMLGLPPGFDLGFNTQDDSLRYMPAYQRYNGIIYRTSRLEEIYHPVGSRRIVFISTLYGLLDATDPIRDYDLEMSKTLNGRRLHTWWQRRGLNDILCEYVRHIRPETTFDLLSGDYRKAVKSWPDCLQDSLPVRTFTYPGQGNGSNYRRGEDLQELLGG